MAKSPLKTVALIATCAFVLLVIGLATVVGPDQIRDIPPLEVRAIGSVENTNAAEATGTTATASQPTETLILIDTDGLPEDSKTDAEALNQSYRNLLAGHEAFLSGLDKQSAEEAIEELNAIMDERRTFLSEANTRLRDKPALKTAGRGLWQAVMDLDAQSRTALVIEHEQWELGANWCMVIADWDREVYFRRKYGLKGRFHLVIRSLNRAILGE